MPDTMTTEAALLAAIAADLTDDTVRLAYADRLQEQGDDARAEFIRVQCRIAAIQRGCSCGLCVKLRGGGQHTNGGCAVDKERDEQPDDSSRNVHLRVRESALLAANPAWLTCPCPSPTCVFITKQECRLCNGTGDLFHGFHPTPRRGFLESLTVPTMSVAARLEMDRCPRCFGGLLPSDDADFNYCDRCAGSGEVLNARRRPTPWLRAVLAACPTLEMVRVADRVPYHNAAGCYVWTRDGGVTEGLHPTAEISGPVFALLAGDIDIMNRGEWRTYRTPDAATDVLARAVVAWGRK